ncbi:MAG: hypothetical protein CVV35_12145 [Methanomicrobiales archaeon HGW-Methanomicrobiales-6]|nr:MAG: hypothetical protein CVV35_12145 [Methanomicrobiales archaeon HGW-Methanomicrobiales-6]
MPAIPDDSGMLLLFSRHVPYNSCTLHRFLKATLPDHGQVTMESAALAIEIQMSLLLFLALAGLPRGIPNRGARWRLSLP